MLQAQILIPGRREQARRSQLVCGWKLATWGLEWGELQTLQRRQIISQEKEVELYSLGEIDLEVTEGILSKHAISRAILY